MGGSAMASWVALQQSVSFAGLVLLNGGPPWKLLKVTPEGRRVPVLFCAGVKDKVVAISKNRLSSEKLKGLGLEVTFLEFPEQGHEVSEEEAERVSVVLGQWLHDCSGNQRQTVSRQDQA